VLPQGIVHSFQIVNAKKGKRKPCKLAKPAYSNAAPLRRRRRITCDYAKSETRLLD
jgi:hypothetical protein